MPPAQGENAASLQSWKKAPGREGAAWRSRWAHCLQDFVLTALGSPAVLSQGVVVGIGLQAQEALPGDGEGACRRQGRWPEWPSISDVVTLVTSAANQQTLAGWNTADRIGQVKSTGAFKTSPQVSR